MYKRQLVGSAPDGAASIVKTFGLFLSEDNGSNWNQIMVGSGYWYVSSIIQSKDALYVGYEEGNVGYVYFTTNNAVSYTHLDVYKRQLVNGLKKILEVFG